MKGISDAQQALVIQTVAKIPVPDARKPFLVALEKLLPAKGRVSDQQALEAVNAALASFKPSSYRGDAQGAYPSDMSRLTLNELASLYQRVVRAVGEWAWPPPTAEQAKARAAEAEKFAALPQEEKAAAYHRSLFATEEEYEAAKRAEEKRRQAEDLADSTPWPLPAPPTTRTIFGSVNVEPEPAARDDAPTDDEPQPPITPLTERAPPRQLSIYGRHLAWLRGELPADDEERARALNEQLEKERLQRRRLQGKMKSFF